MCNITLCKVYLSSQYCNKTDSAFLWSKLFSKLCEIFTLNYSLLIPMKTIAKKILQIRVTPKSNFSKVVQYRRIKDLYWFVNYFHFSFSSADSCGRNVIHDSATKYRL